MARRGARRIREGAPEPGSASAAWRDAAARGDDRDRGRPPAWEAETWIDAGPVREEAERAVQRGEGRPRSRGDRDRSLPADAVADLRQQTGPERAGRAEKRLQEAAEAYARERYRDARKVLGPLAERHPGSAAIRELHGLTLYRLGRWRDAAKELEAFEQLTASVDQHPVRADAMRALGRHAEVERLWDELRRGGAGVEVLVEGRIVMAGSLADRDRMQDAIRLLEQGPVDVRKPKEHHLRLWYALASLYERAGDVTRARALFRRLLADAPDFADASERYDALR